MPLRLVRFLSSVSVYRTVGALALLAWCASPCAVAAQPAPDRTPLRTVAPVDLQRYAGRWYEQARLPNRFQRECVGPVSADYAPRADGSVEVLNRCLRADGRESEAVGEARVVPVAGQPGAGRLEVRFAPRWLSWLPLVWGDYWILRLDPDYRVALVGTPDREYLWVLSRTSRLDPAVLQAELDHARALGFAVDSVIRTGAADSRPVSAVR